MATRLKPKDPSGPKTVDHVVIRFAGDSGDGMQLTGTQFTQTTALMGNDLSTFPDFPAEIRAPAGTTYGVSAFQINFASFDVLTAGDQPDVLVAMNPAPESPAKRMTTWSTVLGPDESFDFSLVAMVWDLVWPRGRYSNLLIGKLYVYV